MKIAVQGATGLIGKNLLIHLRERGIDAVGTYCSSKVKGLKHFDLRNSDYSAFLGCTHVVICGAVSNIGFCHRNQTLVRDINLRGTIKLIDYLISENITPVFLSSDQIFGANRGNYSENDMASPVNVYGELKLLVEKYLGEKSHRHLIFRLSKTYSKMPEDGGLYNEIHSSLTRGKPIKAAFNQIYNPTDVGLVCAGILKAIKKNATGVYHLANRHIKSRYDFSLLVAAELGFDGESIKPIDFTSLTLEGCRPLNTSLNVTKFHEEMC